MIAIGVQHLGGYETEAFVEPLYSVAGTKQEI